MKKYFFAALLVLMCTTSNVYSKSKPEDEDLPLAHMTRTPGMTAIFRTWGFIGDSLCSGEMECWEKGRDRVSYKDMYEYSWGQQICRLCGADGYNFSYGGQTAKGWLESEREPQRTWAGARLNPKQAYIIAMGVNDFSRAKKSGNLDPGDLKSDVDLEDYNKNADTFAGNMAGIVQRVNSVSPGCKIFVVTRPNEVERKGECEPFNDVIRGLADMFDNVYVIDLYRYAPAYDESFRAEHFLNGHLSAEGYLYTAYMFMDYIDWIIRHNPQDFKDVPLYGTPWKTSRWSD